MPKDKKPKEPKAPKVPKKKKRAESDLTDFERYEEESTVKGALARIGLHRRTGSSLVITAHRDTSVPPEKVWEVWGEIEKWPTWDKPIVTSARWVGDVKHWQKGAKFEVAYNWGPGLGKPKTTETAKDVMEPQSVSWFQSSKGIALFGQNRFAFKYCHIWFFEPTMSGGTHIIRTSAMTGFQAVVAKLFGGKRKLTQHYKSSLEALAKLAERAPTKIES